MRTIDHHPVIRPKHLSLPQANSAEPLGLLSVVNDVYQPQAQELTPLGSPQAFGKGLLKAVVNWISRPVPTTHPGLQSLEKHEILSKLQPGDVVLTYRTNQPNLGHLEYWSVGSHHTHCALYAGEGKILETLGNGVFESDLSPRMRGPMLISVVRPPYKDSAQALKVVEAARETLGRPYDYKFDNSDASELYCSEFIEVAMKAVDSSLEAPDVQLFGREITSPDAFLQMPGAELIHDGKVNYWTNQLHQWPVLLTTALGAGAGALVAGPVGATLGLIAGYEGSLFVGDLLKKLAAPHSR